MKKMMSFYLVLLVCACIQNVFAFPGSPPIITGVATNSTTCSPCNGAINITVTGGKTPYKFSWSNGATTEDLSGLCAGSYTVKVEDKDKLKSSMSFSITQPVSDVSATASIISDATCVGGCKAECFESSTIPGIVNAKSTWTINQQAGTVTIRTTLAKTFVDNTYGTNAIGWPNGHTFSNLTGSDNLQLALLDGNGVKKLEFKQDYITSTNTAPSGYATLGVTGGEGQMLTGSATDVVGAKSSLSENFNTFGYVLTTNSPATNANYTPNGSYPNWIFEVWYEVTVNLSAFGTAGFGKPQFVSVHASPSKTGNNTEPVVDKGCCDFNCSGAINLTITSGTGPFTFKWSNGATTEDVTGVCDGDHTVTITDGGGCSKSQTFTVAQVPANISASATTTSNNTCSPPCPTTGEQLCFESPTVPDIVNAVSTWTIDQNAQTITIRTTLTKTFVDNTYGTGAIGWPNGHTFSNLTGSDNLELALYDNNGVKKIDFKMDYITSSSTVPSGYKTLGVTGGEGRMILGTATDVVNVKTSLSENFNTYGYVLTTNSPATDANYTPNAAQPNWIYEVWYEATVKLSVFGAAGFGFPDLASVHASPSKTGNNTEVVDSVHCIPPCVRICDGSINLTVISGTGPITFKWSNGATTEDLSGLCEGEYTVTITDAGGCTISLTKNIGSTNCNDNNACTKDSCASGLCISTPVICNDGDACTLDNCSPQTGCVYPPKVCNDNIACTKDSCVNGQCVYTPGQVDLNISKTNVSCACQGSETLNSGCVLSYDNLLHGEFVNNQFPGVHITGDANGHIDTVIVFNSNISGSPDPDLEVDLGNLLVLPDNITDNNNDNIVDLPNDWAGGGKQIFTFDSPFHIESFIFVDNDQPVTGLATAYDQFNNVITSVVIPITANGGYATVNVNADGVRKFVIQYNGSGGAVGKMIICLPDTCCDGTALATPSGGTAPYAYLWSTGSANASIGNLCPGTYYVTVTDHNGCSNVSSVVIGKDNCTPCDGVTCNDNNPCTNDACLNGQCMFTPFTCNDNNACTTDACSNGQCVFTPIVCNDNNACTTDACSNGQCGYTPISGCGDCPNAISSLTLVRPGTGGDVATLTNGYVINYETLCKGFSIRANACTGTVKSVKFILNGSTFRTESSVPYALNGDNAGSYIAWTPAAGSYTLQVIPYTGTGASGTAGTSLTITFTVTGGTSCTDQNACTTDACNTTTGNCSHTAIPGCSNDPCANVVCNDNNACTTDACSNGQCQYTAIVCNDQNSCTDDLCVNGQCQYTAIVCNDQNSCTNDACANGQCQYTAIVCNDQNSCTNDACANGQCQYTAIVCNDQNFCTNDACVSGECQFTPIQGCGGNPCDASFCDDQNPCTVDVGNGLGDCTHTSVVNTPNYLKLVNTSTNSLNLKVLYGPTSSWVNQNVVAGGNTTLCITLRDATTPGTMAKVHVRLKGSLQNEVTRITNNYPVGCVPRGWTTICIPLTAFPTSDLTALPYVEIFNSAAGPYELHILKIEFTGGTTPFVWFGDSHTNNYVSGNSANFYSQLVTGGPCGGAKLSGDELSHNLEAFPNPFENKLVVSFESSFIGVAEIRIVDMLGQIVKTDKMEFESGVNQNTINLDNRLADGMYFLELRTGDKLEYVKLYKSK